MGLIFSDGGSNDAISGLIKSKMADRRWRLWLTAIFENLNDDISSIGHRIHIMFVSCFRGQRVVCFYFRLE